MTNTFFLDKDAAGYAALAEADRVQQIRHMKSGAGIFQVKITGVASAKLYGRCDGDVPWAFVAELTDADVIENNTAVVGVRMFPHMKVEGAITSGTLSSWVAN